MLQIRQFPCLSDNYGFLVHDPVSGETACIDTPDADAILAEAASAGWRLTQIWNTHWHPDHAGGNAAVKAATGARVFGPPEVRRIEAPLDQELAPGARVSLGSRHADVLDVGGHTLGHIAFVFAQDKAAFVGDSLFALGCGRLFEGDPRQMWDSLKRLSALPDDTAVYCAHEYTAANARFALSVDPDNPALRTRAEAIAAARAKGEPTVPTTIGLEKATNPFLRARDVAHFAELRAAKDTFKG